MLNSEAVDGIEAQLEAMAAQADAGVDPDEIQLGDQKQTPAESEPKLKEEGDSGAEAAKKADEAQKQEKQEEQKAEETPYQKARREGKEREAKAWQKIENEKAALKAEREALEAERTAAKPTKATAVRDEAGYSAEEYDKAAKDFRDEGDTELAKAAETKAAELRSKEQAAKQESTIKQFSDEWEKTIAEVAKTVPDIAKEGSDTFNRVAEVFKAKPYLFNTPRGVAEAYEIADLRTKAASVPELSKQIETLNAEIGRLQKLTDPASLVNPQGKPKAKSLDTMSDSEADAEMRALAENADRFL